MCRFISYFVAILALLLSGCNTLNTKGIEQVTPYSHQSLLLPPAFSGLKIVFMSDLHYPSTLKEAGLSKLIEQVNELEPDLILLGGDYTEKTRTIEQNIETVASYLGQLKAPLGVFAVMGNHDNFNGRKATLTALAKQGIKVLVNQLEWIYKEGDKIALAGLDEPFWGNPNFEPIAHQLQKGDFVLLLSHNPDLAERTNLDKVSLVLSGHTHGGQVLLFGYAPRTSSRYGQKYRYGKVVSSHGIDVIVSSGIGTSKLKLRIGSKPEVVVITFVPTYTIPTILPSSVRSIE